MNPIQWHNKINQNRDHQERLEHQIHLKHLKVSIRNIDKIEKCDVHAYTAG